MSGASIGPYRVLRELGHGGMGTVLLAEDTRLGRQVALKTVSGPQAGTADGRQHLLAEARAAAAISHPAIAAVHDVIEVDGEVAIVFEFVDGETLAARLAKGPLSEGQAVAIAVQLAEALSVAHGHGVLHRDLKPANVMLAPGGAVKILDFGIARLQRRDAEAGGQPRQFLGTPGYVAPEQWVGRPADERADLYALGVVLFEMVSGKRPFVEREPFSLARASLDRMARRLSSVVPDVSPALDRLVSRLLASDPNLRPPRARAVADELRQLQAPATPPPAGRPRWWAWSAAAVVALALGGWAVWASRPTLDLGGRPPVIAVLPLENATGDDSNDYLSAGVADSLVTSLASLPSVTVLSRAAVNEARARRGNPADVARDLDASFVVAGSVQRAGSQVRLALNLLRQDGSMAWADAVEGPADSVFGMQARLAGALGSALSVQMSATDRARLNTPPTSNADALDAYWRGRALLERRDAPGNLQRAVVAFSEALRLDARFVDAQAALAEADWELYDTTREPKYVEAAVQASKNAVALAPEDAGVRVALGVTLTRGGRNAEAVQELQRALAAEPNHDEARRYLGRALAALGRVDEAVAEWRKALVLRPNNWQVLSDMGLALYQAARYAEAEAAYRQLIELQPDNVIGYQMLGAVNQVQGNNDAALEYYGRAIAISPVPQALSNMGALYHERGDFARAVDAYRRAIEQRPNAAATHRNLGDSLLRMGRGGEALAAYRRAADLAEAARAVNPADALNLASLAVYLQKAGDEPAAARRLDEALRRAPADPQVQYRAALVHALAGRSTEALSALERALDLGYSRADAVKADEFERLRQQPRFAALVVP